MNKVIELNPDRAAQREWLKDQIPIAGENETVILPKQFYKNLSDEQFEILITEVDLNILVGAKTERYLKQRMRRLNINPRKYIPKIEEVDKIAEQKKAEQ